MPNSPYKVGVLGGDGIGPEVTREALKVVKAAAEVYGFRFDLVVFRENTEDAYTLIGGFLKKGTPDEVAQQTMIYTRKGVERCVRYAFELARKRPRKKLTLVDKANAIPAHDLWRRTFAEVGS